MFSLVVTRSVSEGESTAAIFHAEAAENRAISAKSAHQRGLKWGGSFSPRTRLAEQSVSLGGPTTCDWLPKAQDVAPSAFDQTWRCDLNRARTMRHPVATRPSHSGRATPWQRHKPVHRKRAGSMYQPAQDTRMRMRAAKLTHRNRKRFFKRLHSLSWTQISTARTAHFESRILPKSIALAESGRWSPDWNCSNKNDGNSCHAVFEGYRLVQSVSIPTLGSVPNSVHRGVGGE